MTICSREQLEFPRVKGRKVEADFSGGDVTSDGGVLLLRQADRRLGLTSEVARLLDDPRRQAGCDHDQLTMLRRRVYGLALGYEDLNDHDALRGDPAAQTAVDKDTVPASSPTLCRWENRADRTAAVAKWRTASRSSRCSSPTSAHRWWPNQLRLLLSALAYTLLEAIRRLALHGTDLARAQVSTIRLKLLKIGAVILRNTRRVSFLLASACPHQDLFRLAVQRLTPS